MLGTCGTIHGAVFTELHNPVMHAIGVVMKYFETPARMATPGSLMAGILASMFLVAGSAPAMADLACGSLVMPAGQLKEVSRGITHYHSGLDLVAPHGSPLRAAAGGTVVMATHYFAYGKTVDIAHGNGVITRYAHMASFASGIGPGAQVEAGQLLGTVGRTGRATTAHVHFEVRINGRPVDPKPYLSLAACTPRTPSVEFLEVRAAPPAGGVPAQVAQAPASVLPGRNASSGRIDARPGGLLE